MGGAQGPSCGPSQAPGKRLKKKSAPNPLAQTMIKTARGTMSQQGWERSKSSMYYPLLGLRVSNTKMLKEVVKGSRNLL